MCVSTQDVVGTFHGAPPSDATRWQNAVLDRSSKPLPGGTVPATSSPVNGSVWIGSTYANRRCLRRPSSAADRAASRFG
jgi:hypothetical protein